MIKEGIFSNSNQSVYVDSAAQCNDLGFNIGGGASTITRSWTIKVFDMFYNPKIQSNDLFCSNLYIDHTI